jgi:hypothetical protein
MTDSTELERRVAVLEAELAAVKEEKAKAEKAKADAAKPRKPWPKIDWTEGMKLPPSAAKAMAAVVPDPPAGGGFNAHAHAQTKPGVPGGVGPPPTSTGGVVERGSGWVEPQPLTSPPGLKYVDQQLDVADAIDKRELERKLGGGRR